MIAREVQRGRCLANLSVTGELRESHGMVLE